MFNWFSKKETSNDNQENSAFSAIIKINLSTRVVMTILSIIAALLGVGSVVNQERTLPQQTPAIVESQLESGSATLTNSK